MIPRHNKPHLYMFVGLPGSGKSSFRRDLLWKHKSDKFSTCVLSTDDYIETNKGDLTYSEAFHDLIKEATKELNEKRQFALQKRMNIIWDQTNLTKKSRKRKLSQFPKEYYKVAVLFDTSMDKIWKVNDKRRPEGRSLSNKIIEDMSIEVPELEEGFDKILIVKR